MKMTMFLFFIAAFWSCDQIQKNPSPPSFMVSPKETIATTIINPEGQTIVSRFNSPLGFQRTSIPENSFAAYLRNLPLKPHGTKVHLFDGRKKWSQKSNAAVIDLDVGKRDLQQCADAVMRMRAEYLFAQKKYDAIQFNFTNGFPASYDKWRQGYRIRVNGNQVAWQKNAQPSTAYPEFRKYLNMVFAYAGTLSLEKELHQVKWSDLQIGDVLIQGGSPGHAVIVVDMAVKEGEEKVFLLAQSYMPAQDIHILTNPNNTDDSPWYSTDFLGSLQTPEWTFERSDLKRF